MEKFYSPKLPSARTSHVRSLLLIAIFVLLTGGIGMALLLQIQAYDSQQTYLATEAALPQHKASKSVYQSVSKSEKQDDTLVNWKTYRNQEYGFEFKYPAEFGGVVWKDEGFFTQVDDVDHSTIGGKIIKQKLDPNNILGLYGKVNKIEQVNIGDKIGYEYLEGDGGCGALLVNTDLNNQTLQISFGYCEGQKGPVLYSEKDLIRQILATFKFTN